VTVRVVTDSTADLPADLVARHGISVVPLSILFGDEALLDGVDVTSEQFFKRLAREPILPTTSQPTPAAFHAVYERLKREGATEILSLHLSSKLSGTFQSALQGAEGITGVRFRHVDSLTVSLGLGLGVLAAATAAEAGQPLETVRATAEGMFARTHVYFVLDTLEFLRRGGRLSRGAEIVGNLLQVKPILSFVDGEVAPVGRVRTRAKAIEEMLRRVSALRPISDVGVIYATTPDDLEYLIARLDGIVPDANVLSARVTPVIGVHSGPGLLGVAVVSADGASPAPAPP
jgi:DegV family protein with EDD domain